jgi:hypothetical protein
MNNLSLFALKIFMFKRTIVDAFKWSTKWYLGSFGGAVSTFLFFKNYLEFEIFRSLRYGFAMFLITFVIRVIVKYITKIDELEDKLQQTNINTKSKVPDRKTKAYNYYGEAIIILKDVFAKVHGLRKAEQLDDKQLITTLVYLCNQTKQIFEKRHNNRNYVFSVSIKVFSENNSLSDRLEVKTLCRDFSSHEERSKRKIHPHTIRDNTCFFEIFNVIGDPKQSHYFSNSLPSESNYQNSSFNVYKPLLPTIKTIEDKRKHWTLPYKSEIVVPISPLLTFEEDRKKQFIGYLCVDCNNENAFHEKYDIEMLKGIADGIFDIIEKHHKSQIEIINQNITA